jgi:flagellar hook-associated protein FlgK
MMSVSAIALSGMNAAQTGLQVAAHNIANLNTEGFRRQQVVQTSVAPAGVSTTLTRSAEPGDSMITDMVGLLQSKNAFLANLAVFRHQDDAMGSLLDAVA